MGFALRDDVYYCIANGQVVLLDLRANKLFCLPPAADSAFQCLMETTPTREAHADALEPLISQGVLCEAPGEGLVGPRTRPVSPLRDLPMRLPQATLAGTLCATVRQLLIMADLRSRPIYAVLGDIRTAKAGQCQRRTNLADPSTQKRLAAMLATRRIIATEDKCLRWSIAMTRHLGINGAYPDLVFGVRMKPFSAHAWVQDGDIVLNDSADHAILYREAIQPMSSRFVEVLKHGVRSDSIKLESIQ